MFIQCHWIVNIYIRGGMSIPFFSYNESSKLPHTSYLIMNKFRDVCCIYNWTILHSCSQTYHKLKSLIFPLFSRWERKTSWSLENKFFVFKNLSWKVPNVQISRANSPVYPCTDYTAFMLVNSQLYLFHLFFPSVPPHPTFSSFWLE